MSQLVLDGLSSDLVERLERHAQQLGVSPTEAALHILPKRRGFGSG